VLQGSLALFVAAAIVAAAAVWLIVVYNGLVRLRNGAHNAFATVDVQLKQRCDLVPNVVAAVKGYMQHERQLLERLTALRTQAVAGGLSDQKRLGIDTQMTDVIIDLGCAMTQIDFRKHGRTLEVLGLEGMTREEMLQYVNFEPLGGRCRQAGVCRALPYYS